MNRETALKQLAIMQAWADGKTIQYRLVGTAELSDAPFKDFSRDAMDSAPAVFNVEIFAWRIKPEPRIVYALMDAQGNLGSGLYNEANATSAVRAGNQWVSMAKFIEVIE